MRFTTLCRYFAEMGEAEIVFSPTKEQAMFKRVIMKSTALHKVRINTQLAKQKSGIAMEEENDHAEQ